MANKALDDLADDEDVAELVARLETTAELSDIRSPR